MVVFLSFKLLFTPAFHWRHFIYAVIGAIFIFFGPLYAQNINFETNDYRTAKDIVVGDWGNPLTWEVWNDGIWDTAEVPPNRDNNVFIEKGKEVRLTQNEEVRNLFIHGQDINGDPPGKKLNLHVYDLNIYGALICFSGVNGEFTLQQLTSGIDDWIYPETGNIIFKGTSRTVVDRNSWSANNQRSSYGVIFNPHPSDTLWINAAFKASRFVVLSGTVVQTVNYDGTPATSTFSFNTMDEQSPGAYGSFIIEDGATLVSEGSREFNQIIRRSDGKPASSFELMEGGNLVLLGERPIIDAENIVLNGNVFYSGDIGTQQFISGSMAGVTDPIFYNHLFFDGNAQKNLPPLIKLKGDLTYLGGGAIDQAQASIHFNGDKDQEVKSMTLELQEVTIEKPSGTLFLDDDLTVIDLFTMTSGEVDFSGNKLFIHGDYNYLSGRWSNLDQLFYEGNPSELTPSNSTFPFTDAYLGGLRRILLSGTLSSPLTDLWISYSQLPGINWDPGFKDGDTDILYQLNSFFTFNLTDVVGDDEMEIQISADNLIVEDDDHLRIVGDGVSAPGFHLKGTDNMARRNVRLNDLTNQILTIGSAGIASILPVTWLSYRAEELPTGNLISWSTATEEANREFLILKSPDGKELKAIGSLPGSGQSNEIRHYQFLDETENLSQKVFYQIKQLDINGGSDATPVFSLLLSRQQDWLLAFPNPYTSADELTLSTSKQWADALIQMQVYDVQGKSIVQETGSFKSASQKIAARIQQLSSGVYFISLVSSSERRVIKLIKTD